jgi:hypothetical protein
LKLEIVVNSFSIVYQTLFLCSFLFLNTLSAQYIQITKPTAAQEIPNKSNLIEIAWKTSIETGHVRIEYSIDNKNYIEVSKEKINESPFNWFIPGNIGTNKHGDLYIRVIISEKQIIQDEVNILVPELASTGSMVFETQLEDVFINIKNKKTLKPGEILRDLEPGEYYYTAKKQKYGQDEGKVVVKAGKREKIKLDLTKTWGSVTFTSKENEDFSIQINRRTPPFEQEHIKQFDAKKKIIYLEKGEYVFSALKENYREYKDSFTIIPNKPITIPINLTLEWSNVRFLSNAPRTMFYTKNQNKDIYLGPAEKVFKLDEGTHTIVAKANNYRRYEKEFVIDPFKTLNEFTINMIPQHGGIVITSDPPGAEILVNLKTINEVTPYTIDNISVGIYSVWIKMDKYQDESIQTKVFDNELTPLFFRLKRNLGILVIDKRHKYQEFDIFVDGKKYTALKNHRGLTTTTVELEEGIHDVKIMEPGYETIQKWIEITSGINRINAVRKPMLTQINLIPSTGMTISLNARGDKPVTKNYIKIKTLMSVRYGNYKIKANAPKHESAKFDLIIDSKGARLGRYDLPFYKDKYDIPIKLERKTFSNALGWSFMGAGMIYAEKPKLGIGLLAGTLGAGSYFIYKDDEYRKESKKLHNLQTEYLSQTDQVQIAASKALRDAQREKRDKIGSEANISLMTTMALYGLNIGITWFFHGL